MEQGTFNFTAEPSPAPGKLCECGCGQPAPIATVTRKKRGEVKGQPLRFIRGHYSPPAGKPQPGGRKLSVEVGQRIGRSVVIDPEVSVSDPGTGRLARGAHLRCDCGNEYERRLSVLFRGPDPSCGCSGGRRANRAGQRFGRLTAVRSVETSPEKRGTIRWLCKCDCGNEVIAAGADLVRGHTKSCGCLKNAPREGYAAGDAAWNKAFRTYRRNARTRDLSWDLSMADFKRLALLDCFYCGAGPSMTMKGSPGSGDCVYNGLDRIDNTLGYALGNVVTACKVCNHAKRDMSFDDFLAWIARLTEYHFFHPDVMPSRLLSTRT